MKVMPGEVCAMADFFGNMRCRRLGPERLSCHSVDTLFRMRPIRVRRAGRDTRDAQTAPPAHRRGARDVR
jgi:hypothetical protein